MRVQLGVLSLILVGAASCSGPEFKATSTPRTVAPKKQAAAEQVAQTKPEPVSNAQAEKVGTILEPAQALADCSRKTLQTKDLLLNFPETKGQCNWDNGIQNGQMMGHLEQTLKLPVEKNWVVCGMKISSDKSDLYYDDYMLLHFNDRALIGSTGLIDFLEKDAEGLPIYSWNKLLRKQPQGNLTCLEGATKCALTGTQQSGKLALEFDEATNRKLMLRALSENRFDFQVVTTGDNDKEIDCAHTGIPLTVSVKYYVK